MSSLVAGLLPRDLRQRLDLRADLAIAGTAPVAVQIIDLSPKGAFVETEVAARPGATALLTIELEGHDLRLDAVVVRQGSGLREAVHPELDTLVVRAPGLGLRFVSLRKRDREDLLELLRRVRRAG